MGTALFIILILILLGVIPVWPRTREWGYGPSGVVVLLLVILIVLLLTGHVSFADTVAVTAPPIDPGPWQAFFTALQPALTALVSAVGLALAGVVTFYAQKYLPSWGTGLVLNVYNEGRDAAAAWLLHQISELGGAAPKQLTIDTPLVQRAVAYMKTSYPKAAEIEPSDPIKAQDILGALAKLAPLSGANLSTVAEALKG